MKSKKFKGHTISDRKPIVGDTMICIQRKNVNYGLTTVVNKAILIDTVNWKVIEPTQIFAEVITGYTDPDGNITIDCYPDTDPNSENARTIARISIDGLIIKGDNPEIKESDFRCPLVMEAIKEVQEEQKGIKQAVIDLVLERIKKDVADGDMTAIDELLMFCPAINLKGYLAED